MQKLKHCVLVLALLTIMASPSQGQADQIAELQSRLEKARAEEIAAKANWDKERQAFEQLEAAYQASLKTSKPLGRPVQVYEKKAHADFDAATKKRATLEAELAKAKAAAAKQVTATPPPAPPPSESDQVRVPDLSGFDNVSEMKAILAHAGLTGAFSAAGKPPSKEKEFKFAAQSPGANTQVKRGSTVSVSIYQKFEDDSEVVVPDLSVFDNVSEMKAVLAHAGLTGAFAAKGKPPSKEKEFKFASQSPPADTKVKRGSTVTVTIYQAFDSGTEATDTVPALIGKTLDQATQMLSGVGLSIGGVDNTAKTDKQDKVNTIFEQSPAAGSTMPSDKRVQVKLYGSLVTKGTPPPSNPLDEMIPGSDRDLIGNFEGQAQVTTFDWGDYKHEHPQHKTQPLKVGIWRDDKGQWHFSGQFDGAGIGEHGSGGTTTVSGGVLTFEQHSRDVDRACTVKVSGNQLVGTCQNTLKDGNLQPGPINLTATRTK